MPSKQLVRDFEAGTLDNSTFTHAEHVYVIWSLIHTHGTLEAIKRFETGLKRITRDAGQPEKYNATITYALGFITAERIAEDPALDWEQFTAANPDLFVWPNQQLSRLYPNGALNTSRARHTFVLPEVIPTK